MPEFSQVQAYQLGKEPVRTYTSIAQARIAISLVQNIPYDYANLYSVSRTESTKYPYQVLYENH